MDVDKNVAFIRAKNYRQLQPTPSWIASRENQCLNHIIGLMSLVQHSPRRNEVKIDWDCLFILCQNPFSSVAVCVCVALSLSYSLTYHIRRCLYFVVSNLIYDSLMVRGAQKVVGRRGKLFVRSICFFGATPYTLPYKWMGDNRRECIVILVCVECEKCIMSFSVSFASVISFSFSRKRKTQERTERKINFFDYSSL